MKGKDVEQLVGRFFEGSFSSEEAVELASGLEADRELRTDFFARLELDRVLEQAAALTDGASARTAGQVRSARRAPWMAAAAAVFIVIVSSILYVRRGHQGEGARFLAAVELGLTQVAAFGRCTLGSTASAMVVETGDFSVCDLRSTRRPNLALRVFPNSRLRVVGSPDGWRVVLDRGRALMRVQRTTASEVAEALVAGLFVEFRGTAVELSSLEREAVVRVVEGEVTILPVARAGRARIERIVPGHVPGGAGLAPARHLLVSGQGLGQRDAAPPREVPLQREAELARNRRLLAAIQAGTHTKPGSFPGIASPDSLQEAAGGVAVRLQLRDGSVLTAFVRETKDRYEGVTIAGRPISVPVSLVRRVDVVER